MRDGIDAINREGLARHLAVERSTLPRILDSFGLEPIAGRFPWRRVFRSVHGVEAARFHGHLDWLRRQYASPILGMITDLEVELRNPLLCFAEMARTLGVDCNTLSRALREGRQTLPITMICLGPRLRRFRPLEVRLWRDEGILLNLPQRTDVTRSLIDGPVTADPKFARNVDPTQKALFGSFAREERVM